MTINPFYRTSKKQVYIPSRSGRLGEGHWVDERDPFGRIPEPSDESQLDVSNPFQLSSTVGRQGSNAREDVGKIECLMKLAGVWSLDPTDGPTGYFGTRLGEAVKSFQKGHGLRVDGEINPDGETMRALGQVLQDMGRNGDTVLAHLTPQEAEFLHDITDGGSINPQTGLMEFWNGDHDFENAANFGGLNAAAAANDQAAENASQGRAFGGDRGDGMASVHAVNRARAQAEQAARARAEKQAREAELARQAKIAREREEAARKRDLEQRQERARKEKELLDRQRALSNDTNKRGAQTGLLGQMEDDNDAQWGSGLWGGNDDQARENQPDIQGKAIDSAKRGDPAGYADMTNVDIVNKARQERNSLGAKTSQPQSVQKPSQYSGKKTYKTKGPITIKVGSTTALFDGLDYYVKWSPLDKNGKRVPTIEMPGNKGTQDANVPFGKAKKYAPTIGNPYGPYGWEVEVSIPPQPAYSGNAGTSWVDVTVSE